MMPAREIKVCAYYRPQNCIYYEIGDGSLEHGVNRTIKAYQEDTNWEVMQFTNRVDKNGLEIYEDFLLSCPFLDRPFSDTRKTKTIICRVDWWEYKWILHPLEDYSKFRYFPHWVECEIVGNAYQNPELIPYDKRDK